MTTTVQPTSLTELQAITGAATAASPILRSSIASERMSWLQASAESLAAASGGPVSVVGGDTASALAAGCPVIVKAHAGHPELSRRTAQLAGDALGAAGAPAGTLALIEGRDAGNALVQHPVVQAAGFTGSLGGGRA